MSTLAIPALRTERLLLRALAAADVEPYAAMMADPEVTRFLGDGRPLGRTEIVSIIRPDNLPSIRVATALGAIPDRTIEFFGAPPVLYRYPPPPVPATHDSPPPGRADDRGVPS